MGSTEQKNENLRISELILGFFEQVTVDDFRITDGKVQFKDFNRSGNNTLGFKEFSLILDHLKLLPNPNLPIPEQFNVNDIELSLSEYKLKLKDNLHVILADGLSINSRENILQVENLSITPEDQSQIQFLVDKYGKTYAVDFSVPLFRAMGMDVKDALFNRNLRIQEILLPGPDFIVSTYKLAENKGSKDKFDSTEDIKNLLLRYFDQIQIDSITLDKAKISYESLVESKKSKLEENDLRLQLKNFKISSNDSSDLSRSFFSDELNLTFNNYFFTIAGSRYQAETDFLNYNSKAKTILMTNLALSPSPAFKEKMSLALRLPNVNFRGVQIEDFFFDGLLSLQKLEVENGLIEIGIDKRPTSEPNLRSIRNKGFQNQLSSRVLIR